MKKLITLTLALLFTAGIVYGQNANSIEQTGNSNHGNIDQVSPGTATAGIDQNGNNNRARIDQESDAGSVLVTANIDQTGNNNVATIDQVQAGNAPGGTTHQAASIVQDGFSNRASQSMSSNSGLTMEATQLGNDNFSKQTIHSGFTMDMSISQDGNNNYAFQKSSAQYSEFVVKQIGNNNHSKQVATGNGWNHVVAEQYGNNNVAKQDLNGWTGDRYSSRAKIYQDGNSNFAKQKINAVLGRGYDPIDISLTQKGYNNWAKMDLTGTRVSSIWQDGNNNTASITSSLP